MPILILASNSPRRRELLALGNTAFDICVSNVDESQQAGEAPRAYVLRLAREKALAVAGQTQPGQIIIGSDTAVIDGAEILGKPASPADATRMLKQLRGRIHQVYTAVAVYRPQDQTMITELCVIDVPMRAYTDAEIDAYIATGDPLDKAGAYAIQHAAFSPVAELRGCYAGVMGLPLCHLARALKHMATPFATDIPQACQHALQYACPVWQEISAG